MFLVIRASPKHEGKELHPGGTGCSQKGRRDQSHQCARRADMLGFLRTKIEYTLLNSRPFETAFSGIDRV